MAQSDMDNDAAAIRKSIRPERRLRVSKISDVTLLRYHSHVMDFLGWVKLRKKKLICTERQVDVAMSTYFNEKFEDDRSFSLGSYTGSLSRWSQLSQKGNCCPCLEPH